MGFYRSIIKGTPHSMPGGYYYSSWQTAVAEKTGYLRQIRFNNTITSLNISNTISNTYNFTDPNHSDYPVFGIARTSKNNTNMVTGINISDYDKLYLNSNCVNLFLSCRNCNNWNNFNKLDFTYVTNCMYMFSGCSNFNQPVTIGNNVTDCYGMFTGCNKFNQPVIIGNSATDCRRMFVDCTKFNQPVTISNSVTRCDDMFMNCLNLKQPVTIGNGVISCVNMFSYGSYNAYIYSFEIVPVPDIYVKGTEFRNIYTSGMVSIYTYNSSKFNYSTTRSYQLNIYFNSVLQNQFMRTDAGSLINTSITWTAMSNGRGYYNSKANIYLFNDYEG